MCVRCVTWAGFCLQRLNLLVKLLFVVVCAIVCFPVVAGSSSHLVGATQAAQSASDPIDRDDDVAVYFRSQIVAWQSLPAGLPSSPSTCSLGDPWLQSHHSVATNPEPSNALSFEHSIHPLAVCAYEFDPSCAALWCLRVSSVCCHAW